MKSRLYFASASAIGLLGAAMALNAAPQPVSGYGSVLEGDSAEHAQWSTDVFAYGALTFGGFVAFDFSTAGLGSTTFFRAPGNWAIDFNRPGAVQQYTDKNGATSSADYAAPASMFEGGSKFAVTTAYASYGSMAGSEEPVLTSAPEPATWASGILCLAGLAATMRRRLPRFAARAA